jgi:ATP-dependent exoDNAse (exonuclease V) beta subunit
VDQKATELAREQKEGERIAYVAATRARDLLVVPAVGDEPYGEGWVSPLNAAIYPPENDRRQQKTAPGCPSFQSKDSVLTRPNGDPASRTTVCPGAHTIGASGDAHEVVWWSPEPGALTLGAQASFGLRRDDLIVKDVAPDVIRDRLEAYESWKAARTADRDAASRPTINVMTATEAAMSLDDLPVERIEVAFVQASEAKIRPGGVRFGSLVHALLADVPLGEDGEPALARLSDAHGRILGAPPEEVAAAREAVAAVLTHPVLAAAGRAARAGQCYRETPVTIRLDTGAMVEGYVDLAYRDEGAFVVVDFKTDRELEDARERYEKQVSLYAAAIRRSTGLPTRAVLMQV